MRSIKKIFYTLFIVITIIVVVIVIAANSSWLIKIVADKFAPDYNISYSDIRGNVFTGIKIEELKYDNKTICKHIKFSWNPSTLLYERVTINELSIYELDVNVTKSLIASFSTDDSNNSDESSELPVVIIVDNVHLDVKPFKEQEVEFNSTTLDIENIIYNNSEIGIEKILLDLSTNLAKVSLSASLEDKKVIVNNFSVINIDSLKIEELFIVDDNISSKNQLKNTEKTEKKEELNPLIPRKFILKNMVATLKSRIYKNKNIDKLKVKLYNIDADIVKILNNKKDSLSIDRYTLEFQSDLGQINLLGKMNKSIIDLEYLDVKKLDILALQELFINDDNSSKSLDDENITNINETKEKNKLIPEKLILKKLYADVVPFKYEPVEVFDFSINAKDIKFDILKLLVEDGDLRFDAKTNLTNISHKSKIINNILLGNIIITPQKELYETYELPIRQEAIDNIIIDIEASPDTVEVNLNIEANKLLIVDINTTDINATKPFNIDINKLVSKVIYSVENNSMKADTDIMVTTPYTKNLYINNKFIMDENISYSGLVDIAKIIGIDDNLTKSLNNLNIKYIGDLKSVKADILSDGLVGKFISSDFKKGDFHIETSKELKIDEMFPLPNELNGSKVNFQIDLPLNFEEIMPINAKVNVQSNLSNINATLTYGDTLKAVIINTIPEKSLLKNFDKNVQWNAISPLKINAILDKNNANLLLKSKELFTNINYTLDTEAVNGSIKLAGLITNINGIAKEQIKINTNVDSMSSLLNSVKAFYVLDNIPSVEGSLNLSAEIKNLEEINFTFISPKIVYTVLHEAPMYFDNLKFILNANKSKAQLKSYAVTYNKMDFFSTKPSIINFKYNIINIESIWLNNELKITGYYDLNSTKGNILTDAKKLHFEHEMIDIDSSINIETIFNAKKTAVNGKVVILGGEIHYDFNTKSYPADSDIVIVQNMKDENSSEFMDNLSIFIDIDTKKPLIIKQNNIDVKVKADVNVYKSEYSGISVLGEATIIKGGSYTFEGKKFILNRSKIYFTGNPYKPLLDMSIKYKSLNHLITINVTGTPTAPNILFSSVPSLSKEQILSVILFDSEGASDTNSAEDMMKMMGGAMAKSVLSNIGIKLDHLVLGADGSMEVGKKLTDKIMFVYLNNIIPQVKVKYLHTPRLESVISADEESDAYDIVYKRDFSSDDIIIFK